MKEMSSRPSFRNLLLLNYNVKRGSEVSYMTETQKNQHQIMRRHFIHLSAVFFVASVIAPQGATASSPLALEQGEEPLPLTAINTASGASFSLSDVVDSPLIINFWATWCPPCVHELPHLNRLASELKSEGISVLLVSMDRGGPVNAAPFLSARGIDAPLQLYDPSASWARTLKLKGLPTTLLIPKDRASYLVHTGPAEWDDEKIKDQIRTYLNF